MHMRVLLALGLLLLSGCADVMIEAPGDTADSGAPAESAPPETPNAPETPARPAATPSRAIAAAEPHGEVDEDWGPVGTRLDGTEWVSQRTVSLRNGIGDADLIELALDMDYAEVTISDDIVGEYTYDFVLYVRAGTQQAAEDGMDAVDLQHADALTAGTLQLSTDPIIGRDIPITLGNQPQLSFELQLSLPWHLAHAMELDARYTRLDVGSFFGPSIDLSGEYSDVAAATLEAASITTDLRYSDAHVQTIDAQTWAGALDYSDMTLQEAYLWDLSIDARYSELEVGAMHLNGDGVIEADYSEIRLDVLDTAGYDINIETRYSDAMIDLPDLEVLEQSDDRTHVRTVGIDGKALRADIVGDLRYSDLRIG